MGIASLSTDLDDANTAAAALVVHLIGYVITNLAAFLCAIIYYNWTGKEGISDYRGLAARSPTLALALSIALFSLAGMPLFAGFVTKFILFQAAWDADLIWLASIAVFASFVSLYYYLLIIKEMYLGEPEDKTPFPTPFVEFAALAVLVIGIFFVGLGPQPLYNAAEDSTAFIFVEGQAGIVSDR